MYGNKQRTLGYVHILMVKALFRHFAREHLLKKIGKPKRDQM